MKQITIDDRTYNIEFRYIHKEGKRAQIHRWPVRGVTVDAWEGVGT